MWSITEDGGIRILGLVVTLITVGLIPYLISRNSKQHQEGKESREIQQQKLENLEVKTDGMQSVQNQMKNTQAKIEAQQSEILAALKDIKRTVMQLETNRHEDKKEFLQLYERVVKHESQA